MGAAVESAVVGAADPRSTDETDTRERLIRAATEVFLERGYAGTRVQDIARRAGYTTGALYQHFPGRTALLAEAIGVAGRSIVDMLIDAIADVRPGDGEVSRALAYFTTLPPTPVDRLLLEALALAAGDAETKRVLAGSIERLSDLLVEQIDLARSAGLIDADVDTPALCQVFVSWLLGVVVMKAVDLPGVGRERLVALNARLFSGLGIGTRVDVPAPR